MLHNICLYFVKMCHCDWFNKELDGQDVGRREQAGFPRERELWEEERWGVASEM